ncbi:hypothetical protein EB73_14420 [Mycobacterium sp. SWH-M3]|nr:hypothetical protein EB73_14420 [Mycobacterium sp. SWH-M3]
MLRVPELTDDADTLTAALAYARCGWFVLPVCKDTRHAGSVVGKGWPDKSSREPQQIAAWFAGTDFGIALHCNKSGAFVLDIDKPDRFRHWHLVDTAMVQNTRPDTDARRGHYCWLAPDGFYSNSPAGIGTGWGEVRASANGVIIAAPGIGDRRWLASGPLQPLPLQLVAMLRGGSESVAAVPAEAVRVFVAEHSTCPTVRPDIAARWRSRFVERAVIGKDSRHTTMLGILPDVFHQARFGRINARIELNRLYELWAKSVVGHVRNGEIVTEESAIAEFLQMSAWAFAQVLGKS